jgi:hypothetical protein
VPLEPKLSDVLLSAFDALQNSIHTCLPGRVKSYDSATQTAEIIPVVKQAFTNTDGSIDLVELPVLPNVPVAWPRAGGCYLHFPMAAGDHVMLVFSEAAYALWRETGKLAEPGDRERHSLSYAFAYPGIAPDADAFADAPASEAVLVVGSGGALRVSEAGAGAAAQPVMTADAFLTVLQAACTAAGAATVAVGAGGASAAFTAFIGVFSAAGLISSSKLKAQFP